MTRSMLRLIHVKRERGGTTRGMPRLVPDGSDEKLLRPASVGVRGGENNDQGKRLSGTLFILSLDLARGEWSVRSDFPSEGTPFYTRRARRESAWG